MTIDKSQVDTPTTEKEKAAPPTLQEEWVSAATVNYEDCV